MPDSRLDTSQHMHTPQTVALRSTQMYLMYEDLARAHSRERLQQAHQARRGHELALAQRFGRKAERASLQARLHLARTL